MFQRNRLWDSRTKTNPEQSVLVEVGLRLPVGHSAILSSPSRNSQGPLENPQAPKTAVSRPLREPTASWLQAPPSSLRDASAWLEKHRDLVRQQGKHCHQNQSGCCSWLTSPSLGGSRAGGESGSDDHPLSLPSTATYRAHVLDARVWSHVHVAIRCGLYYLSCSMKSKYNVENLKKLHILGHFNYFIY